MRDNLETIAVPAMLMALISVTIGMSGLNPSLFTYLQQVFGLLPDAFWANMTLLGDALVTLVLLTLLASRHPSLLSTGIVGGVITTLIVRSLKPLLDIERPFSVLGEQVHTIGPVLHTASFPSGHTTAIFLLAGVYALVLQRERITGLMFCLALLVGFSRVAVGAHWPVDIFAGAAIGWGSAWAGWKLAQHWQWVHRYNGRQTLAAIFLLLSLLLFFMKTGYPQTFWLQTGIATLGTLACLHLLWQTWRNHIP